MQIRPGKDPGKNLGIVCLYYRLGSLYLSPEQIIYQSVNLPMKPSLHPLDTNLCEFTGESDFRG